MRFVATFAGKMAVIDPSELVVFSSDAAFVVNAQQKVVAWNTSAENLLGYSAKEALGKSCADLLRAVLPDGGALCCEKCEGIRGLRLCHPYAASECFAEHKDGSRVAIELSTIAVPGDAKSGANRPVAIILLRHRAERSASTPSHGDSRLQIQTLGRFAVSVQGCCLPLEQWPRKQAVQLLKFLSFHEGRPLHRERLVEYLWPDVEAEAGWARLKVTVFFLRQKLRDAGLLHDVVATVDSSYVLRSDRILVDKSSFEDLAREGRDYQRAGRLAEAVHAFEEARRLYRGDYMEADAYADWCAEERQRLLEMYLDVLGRLADVYSIRGDHASAAQVCQAALVREPCRESIHRRLIYSLIQLQRPDRALAQYERCRHILRSEVGVEPSPETASLAESISGTAARGIPS